MNRVLAIVIFFSLLTYNYGLAQSCTQTLRLAQETYNAGRLHELPKICEKCLEEKNEDHFSKQEMVTAYKLLTQAYIYLEEPELADKSMLNLLRADGFFEVNKDVDPAEFLALYEKFRTKPVVSLAIKFGLTSTFADPTSIYPSSNGVLETAKFNPGFGIYVGIGAEKLLSSKYRLSFAPEFYWISKSYSYENSQVFQYSISQNSAMSTKNALNTAKLDFYPLIHFDLFEKSTLNPFIGIGPGISYLLSANYVINTIRLDETSGLSTNSISGSTINSTKQFNKLTYSAIVMFGGKFRIGSIYITADVRFQYGLSNAMNINRTNQEALFDYAYQAPDYKVHNVMGTIGAIVPIFVPKKLVK